MNEAVTLGFDQVSQSWTTGCSGLSVAQVPPLDGTLLIDEAALGAAADDFGNLRQQLPLAVLEPASTQDVVSMVSFAREQGIKIGPRGQGISTYGEAQVPGGLVIKLNTLRQAPVLGPDWVEVSPGLAWRDVLLATLEPGLRPPVLTQTLYLSVGGTLSVGGIDGGSYRYGAQVDNVLEMQVVTGEGRLVTCSETEERELFEAVLAGRGQCGIVVRARLRLIPAETHTLFFQLLYRDLDTLLDDHRMLIADGRFDRTSTYVMPSGKGRWTYYLQGARNFTPPSLPDQVSLLAGMQHLRGFEKVSTLSYFEYADRGGRHKEQLRNQGRLNLPHPFFNAILPASAIKEYAAEVFASLDSSLIEPDFPVEFMG